MTAANDQAIRRALEAAGIEFIAKNGGGIGVCLRAPRNQRKLEHGFARQETTVAKSGINFSSASPYGTRTLLLVRQSRTKTLLDIKAALEAGGIEFVGTPNDRPGVRLLR